MNAVPGQSQTAYRGCLLLMECHKYVLQPVRGPHLHVLSLFHQPALDKYKVLNTTR